MRREKMTRRPVYTHVRAYPRERGLTNRTRDRTSTCRKLWRLGAAGRNMHVRYTYVYSRVYLQTDHGAPAGRATMVPWRRWSQLRSAHPGTRSRMLDEFPDDRLVTFLSGVGIGKGHTDPPTSVPAANCSPGPN